MGSDAYPFGQDAHHQDKYPAIDLQVTDEGETVTDRVTGLVWERCSAGQTFGDDVCGGSASTQNFAAAVSYCDGLTTGGHTWRVPTAVEYTTILNWGVFDPVMDPVFFPDNPSSTFYWTSSGDSTNGYVQWMFGGDLTSQAKTQARPVRCVTGASFAPDLEASPDGPIVDTNLDRSDPLPAFRWGRKPGGGRCGRLLECIDDRRVESSSRSLREPRLRGTR